MAAPSEAETDDVRRRYDAARQKGWIQAQLFVISLRYEGTNPMRIADHWAARPQARNLIYIGVGSMVLAVSIGFSLGAFD